MTRRCRGCGVCHDSQWSAVNLPHSFARAVFFASSKFYVGWRLCRKHFAIPKKWRGKRIQLEFDGAFEVAEHS